MKKIFDPPGGFLIWLVLCTEFATFSALIIILLVFRSNNLELYQAEANHLLLYDGMVLTLSLLTSGFFAAEGVRSYFSKKLKACKVWFTLSILSGAFFLVYKYIDYQQKVEVGLTLDKNDFWMYYWLITGFHFVHVVIGVFILSFILYGVSKKIISDSNFTVRGGVLFWHMCDAIWLLLFPLLYVLKGGGING
ncbi:MAG: cytochrome c oxidase subunit 3 [Bdellovibrionales bacterium]|nr:cytochrome c oxidase subunit 3 [Bdellovibrionales bacterium]